jgi:hypothetical protein
MTKESIDNIPEWRPSGNKESNKKTPFDHLEYMVLNVNKITKNPWNPNAMDDPAFNRLVSEIQDVGFNVPIQVVRIIDDKTGEPFYRIIGGEHRWSAAKVLGMKNVPAIVMKNEKFAKDDELQKQMVVRFNQLHGKIDPRKFTQHFGDMVKKYTDDELKGLLAFTDTRAFQSLMTSVRGALKGSGLPKEIVKELDKSTENVKSIDDLSMILRKLFTKYGNDLKHSFMVFSFGGKDHLFVEMDKKMMKQMDIVKDFCRSNNLNINNVMISVVKKFKDYVDTGVVESNTKNENKS